MLFFNPQNPKHRNLHTCILFSMSILTIFINRWMHIYLKHCNFTTDILLYCRLSVFWEKVNVVDVPLLCEWIHNMIYLELDKRVSLILSPLSPHTNFQTSLIRKLVYIYLFHTRYLWKILNDKGICYTCLSQFYSTKIERYNRKLFSLIQCYFQFALSLSPRRNAHLLTFALCYCLTAFSCLIWFDEGTICSLLTKEFF